MPIRPFRLPDDIPVLIDVIPPSFQYPENTDWSIQHDEAESLIESLEGVRRLWPLIRVVQMVYAPMRDVLRGYIWEEDGQAVGVANVLRRGDTAQWVIGNVSVLPEYRRRGIARALVEASVEYARERGAARIMLDVVDGNVPAMRLYETLGFERFSGESQLLYEANSPLARAPLPDDYTLEPARLYDWRPSYALAERITPETVRRYRPVEAGTFRQPAVLRPLLPLIFRATGARPHAFRVRRRADRQVVAHIVCRVRTRDGGMNTIVLILDPAHGAIAPALVTLALERTLALAPGRRVELAVPHWQRPTINAALAAGFCTRFDYLSMGLIV